MAQRKHFRTSGVVRVQVLSDIHAEMSSRDVPSAAGLDTAADIVVVAGDAAHAHDAVATAVGMFPTAPALVMVGGNHEHYGTRMSIGEGLAVMRAAAAEASAVSGRTVTVLENEEVVVGVRGVAVRIVGCTMWTDYALLGDPDRDRARVERCINDYRLIRGGQLTPMQAFLGDDPGLLTTGELLARHAASRAFVEAALSRPHDGPTIAVTHHLPSMRSVAQRFRRDRVSTAFASSLDDLVGMGATLWVHGHTHDSCLWRAPGGTLVACNPAGYPMGRAGRENPKFQPRMVIDIRRGGPASAWRAGRERARGTRDAT